MNQVRRRWCHVYLFLSGIFFVAFCIVKFSGLREILKDIFPNALWCLCWTSFGIALGLYNSRESGVEQQNSRSRLLEHEHYYTYFLFVLFVGSLAAFILLIPEGDLKLHAVAALTAMTIGFTGDALAGIIIQLSKLR